MPLRVLLPALLLWLLLPVCMPSSQLLADDLRPVTFQLQELTADAEAGRFDYQLLLRLPPRVRPENAPRFDWPESCRLLSAATLLRVLQCSQPLPGSRLSFRYPESEVSNPAVARLLYVGGEEHTLTLSPGARQWQLPTREATGSVFLQYTWLGMEHIWIGYDHLLFLLCLVWIAGSLRRLLLAVTGFTLAHSLTLVLAALGLVRLPPEAVEAVIALSVLLLAVELVKGPGSNLTWRYPLAVSAAFGLLHGLGFAAVLHEIGLPQVRLITGLLSFNLGVEIGQAVFVLLVSALLALLRFSGLGMETARKFTGYGVGLLAGYWFIERMSRVI